MLFIKDVFWVGTFHNFSFYVCENEPSRMLTGENVSLTLSTTRSSFHKSSARFACHILFCVLYFLAL